MSKLESCIIRGNPDESSKTWCGREVDEEESRFPHVPKQIPNLYSNEICQRCANAVIAVRCPLPTVP